MAPHRTLRRLIPALTGPLLLSVVLVACSGGSQPALIIAPSVGFDQMFAVDSNSPAIVADQRFACGSRDFAFGQELVTLANPAQATVQNEWAEIVPGKLMYMTGKISMIEGGAGTPLRGGADLPFDHPFGDDFTFNTILDKPFANLSQRLGSGATDIPAGSLHTELEKGQIPHSDASTFLDGFLPQDGDRVAAYGKWIIDCGHNDFHTEIHPPSFIAYGHTEGSATVSHSFYYPYEVTEVYNPDPTLANEVTNTARFTDAGSKTLPGYFVDELLRIIQGQHDRVQAHILVKAHDAVPVTWYVCAPSPRPAGAKLTASYQFTARPGIDIVATPNDSTGCVRFDLKIGAGYQPATPNRVDCSIPWATLDPQLQQALMNPNLSILDLIKTKVGAAGAAAAEHDPVFDCYDPFVVGTPGPANGSGVVTDGNQPYPFYGQAKVSWSS